MKFIFLGSGAMGSAIGGILDLSEERVRIARAAYYGLVEYTDSNVGRILDCLEETGLAGNTLVIYTTIHGECRRPRVLVPIAMQSVI